MKWGWLPFAPLITQRFDSLTKIEQVKIPVLVVHGTTRHPGAAGARPGALRAGHVARSGCCWSTAARTTTPIPWAPRSIAVPCRTCSDWAHAPRRSPPQSKVDDGHPQAQQVPCRARRDSRRRAPRCAAAPASRVRRFPRPRPTAPSATRNGARSRTLRGARSGPRRRPPTVRARRRAIVRAPRASVHEPRASVRAPRATVPALRTSVRGPLASVPRLSPAIVRDLHRGSVPTRSRGPTAGSSGGPVAPGVGRATARPQPTTGPAVRPVPSARASLKTIDRAQPARAGPTAGRAGRFRSGRRRRGGADPARPASDVRRSPRGQRSGASRWPRRRTRATAACACPSA